MPIKRLSPSVLMTASLALLSFQTACTGRGGSNRVSEALLAPTADDLYRAVTEQKVDRVRSILKRGVSPKAGTANKESPLAAALAGVTGPTRDPGFSSKKWAGDSPQLLILQDIMRAVRGGTHQPFDVTGELSLLMQEGPSSPETGMVFLWTAFLKQTAARHELLMSGWETSYQGIERPDGWSPVLRPGSKYRVIGAEKGGRVEVYSIELVGAPVGTNSMRFPISNYLPSTFEYMRVYTWLGRPKDQSKRPREAGRK